jgi:hypothetical protein
MANGYRNDLWAWKGPEEGWLLVPKKDEKANRKHFLQVAVMLTTPK